jgi:cytochrome c-type biogenesis protein CcmH
MKRQITFSILVLLVISLALVRVASAQQGVDPGEINDDQVNAIARQLYCPVCENIPLDVCGTQACTQWRELIREKLAAGWGEDEIKEYFVLQYGDRVLAEPPRRGFNWLVYLVPPAAFLTGIYILYRGIQSWRQDSVLDAGSDESPEVTADDYITRLEEELRRSDH